MATLAFALALILTRSLKRTQGQRDGDLFWSISTGIGGTEMPAYDTALSEHERWNLVNDLRALKNQAPAASPETDS